MRPTRTLRALLVVVGLIGVAAFPAAAQTPGDATTAVDHAAAWLATAVNPDGSMDGFAPGTPDVGLTAQGALALVSTGTSGDVVARMRTFLAGYATANAAALDAGQLAWLALVAEATGTSPTLGIDVVAALRASQQPSGLFGGTDPTFDGTFRQGLALLALTGSGAASTDPAVVRGTAWLVTQQCAAGGWTAFRTDTSVPCPAVDPTTFAGPDTNSTALAVSALAAGGSEPGVTADGADWLTSVRTPAGGWAYLGDATQPADANSTALVVQALLAARGGAPDARGVASLRALQVVCDATTTDPAAQPDPADVGGIAFQPDADGALVPNALATVQAIPAIAGVTLPIGPTTLTPATPAAADCSPPPPPSTTTTASVLASSPTTSATGATTGTAARTGTLPRTGPALGGDGSALAVVTGVVLLALGAALVGGTRLTRRRT